jgi:hypothetical protein
MLCAHQPNAERAQQPLEEQMILPHSVEAGQRVRVTLRKAVWGWAGNERIVVHPAGTVYEGITSAVDADTFFELQQDEGLVVRFSTYDMGISIQEIAH